MIRCQGRAKQKKKKGQVKNVSYKTETKATRFVSFGKRGKVEAVLTRSYAVSYVVPSRNAEKRPATVAVAAVVAVALECIIFLPSHRRGKSPFDAFQRFPSISLVVHDSHLVQVQLLLAHIQSVQKSKTQQNPTTRHRSCGLTWNI